jgi:hypothetical protein
MTPSDCFFIDATTTPYNGRVWNDERSWLALALKVPGMSLKELAETVGSKY